MEGQFGKCDFCSLPPQGGEFGRPTYRPNYVRADSCEVEYRFGTLLISDYEKTSEAEIVVKEGDWCVRSTPYGTLGRELESRLEDDFRYIVIFHRGQYVVH